MTLTAPITISDNLIPDTDMKCNPWPDVGLAPGETYQCKAGYTVTADDVSIGSVTNLATASSGSTTSPTASETIPNGATPALTVTKTSVDTSYTSVGDVLNYSYLVENTGNASFTADILVTDDKIGTFVCWSATAGSDEDFTPADPLAVPPKAAETTTCSRTYTVIQADLDAGSVTNTAYASTVYASTTDVYSPQVNLTIDILLPPTAVDDDFSTTPIGNLGGNTATVITNDSLNGVSNPVIGTDVSLTPGTAPTPAAGSIVMNTDGTITVAPGTTAGSYTYDYTICEIGNTSNCDTATATLQVNTIDALDNDFSTTPIGNLGGNTATVITNDSLNGVANPVIGTDVSLTPGTAPDSNITMNADGTITVAPGTAAGSLYL